MRTLRYRQVLRYRTKGYGKNTYKGQVGLQQGFYLEDNVSTPSIEKVRELHSEIGTWDKNTRWERIPWGFEPTWNNIFVYLGNGKYKNIKPKANYNAIRRAKEERWKEQERRTEEFLSSMGV